MINLLSENRKCEIRAARVNVFLTRYIGIVFVSIIFILGVLYASFTVLQQTMITADARVESNDLKADVYTETKQEIDALTLRLNGAKVALNEEKSYAKALTTLGRAMPTGTVLDTLTIDQATLSGTATELVAYAKTDADAVLITNGLRSSQLFSSLELKGTESDNGITNYPVKVTFNAVFNGASL